MSAEQVLDDLEEAWVRFAYARRDGASDRIVILRREDGSEQALFLPLDGSEWRFVERSGEDVEFQAQLLQDPARCLTLLRAAERDSAECGGPTVLLPEAVAAIRGHLTDAGLQAPEAELWEIYEKKGV